MSGFLSAALVSNICSNIGKAKNSLAFLVARLYCFSIVLSLVILSISGRVDRASATERSEVD